MARRKGAASGAFHNRLFNFNKIPRFLVTEAALFFFIGIVITAVILLTVTFDVAET